MSNINNSASTTKLVDDIDKFLHQISSPPPSSSVPADVSTTSTNPQQQFTSAIGQQKSFNNDAAVPVTEEPSSPAPISKPSISQAQQQGCCTNSGCQHQRQHLAKELRKATQLLQSAMAQWEAERKAHKRTQKYLEEALRERHTPRRPHPHRLPEGGDHGYRQQQQHNEDTVNSNDNSEDEGDAAISVIRGATSIRSPATEDQQLNRRQHRPTAADEDLMQMIPQQSPLKELFAKAVERRPVHHHHHHHQDTKKSIKRDVNSSSHSSQHHSTGESLRSPPRRTTTPHRQNGANGTAFASSSPRFSPALYGTTSPHRDQGHSFCVYQTTPKSGLTSVSRQQAVQMLNEGGREEAMNILFPLRSPTQSQQQRSMNKSTEGRQMSSALDDLRKRLVGR